MPLFTTLLAKNLLPESRSDIVWAKAGRLGLPFNFKSLALEEPWPSHFGVILPWGGWIRQLRLRLCPHWGGSFCISLEVFCSHFWVQGFDSIQGQEPLFPFPPLPTLGHSSHAEAGRSGQLHPLQKLAEEWVGSLQRQEMKATRWRKFLPPTRSS